MSRFKLFEEFNPYSGLELAKKLRLYAEASSNVRFVTPIVEKGKDFEFVIHTNNRADYVDNGFKVLRVEIPFSQIDKAVVVTYEGEAKNLKKVLTTSIEIPGEDDLEVILLNYLEAANLYDDGDVQDLIDNCRHLETVHDIHKVVSTLTPE